MGLPPHGAPPSNPRRQPRWLSDLLGPRSGPVSFWEKLTRATSRSAIAITLILRARLALRSGLQPALFPGGVLREHGASGKAGSWRRAAVARQADRQSEALLSLGRCAGDSKGERKARGRRNSKAGNATPEAPLRGRRRFSQRAITRPAVRRGVMRKGFRVRTDSRPKLPNAAGGVLLNAR